METTRNELSKNEKKFFEELSNYLETPILFFGSIQRSDYFPGKSDIDVDIFTDNESSLIAKMQHFLHVKRSKIKKFVWRLNHNNKVVFGYKIMVKRPELGFNTEISIYDNSIKEDILYEHIYKTSVPFYITTMLIILKFLYYNLGIVSKSFFSYWKKKLLTTGIGLPHDDFVVLDNK